MGDFLRRDVETPLTEHFLMAGVVGAISTNCQTILTAARHCFPRLEVPTGEPGLRLRFWVDPQGTTESSWRKPFCRGLDHLVFAGFDSQSAMLVDLPGRRAIGRFSPAGAADAARWQVVIFPIVISLMGAAVGITELHCACVSREGRGLLLAGPSGAGKSTLALALAQAGFALLTDDRTYLSSMRRPIDRLGSRHPHQAPPGCSGLVPRTARRCTPRAPDEEQALRIDPTRAMGIQRLRACEPQALVFLDRQDHATFELSPMAPSEAAAQLAGDLMVEPPDAAEKQQRMIAELVERPCWRLRHGGTPQAVAEEFCRRTW